MPVKNPINADAVFSDLDMVAELFSRLSQSPLWTSEGRRLPTALQDITGALAHAAFTEFPDDERRWRAGSMLLDSSRAFAAALPMEMSTTWNSIVLTAEAEILQSSGASKPAVATAFRNVASRILVDLETADAAAREAALTDYDDLAARLPEPEPAVDHLPTLIAALERLDMRSELLARLGAMASSPDDRVSAFAQGRLLILKGRDVPVDLIYTDINGASIDLSEMRGKVVLLQFWASWCAPCRAEIPYLRSAHDLYGQQGLTLLGVSLDSLVGDESQEESRLRVKTFMRENGMDWPSHFDGLGWNNACAKSFGIRRLPASLLLDREGRIASVNPRGEEIAAQVQGLLI